MSINATWITTNPHNTYAHIAQSHMHRQWTHFYAKRNSSGNWKLVRSFPLACVNLFSFCAFYLKACERINDQLWARELCRFSCKQHTMCALLWYDNRSVISSTFFFFLLVRVHWFCFVHFSYYLRQRNIVFRAFDCFEFSRTMFNVQTRCILM